MTTAKDLRGLKVRAAARRLAHELEDEAPPDRKADRDNGDGDTGVDKREDGEG
jgi:hypothetical protein